MEGKISAAFKFRDKVSSSSLLKLTGQVRNDTETKHQKPAIIIDDICRLVILT